MRLALNYWRALRSSRLALILSCAFLVGCESVEEKARIRLAVTAYSAALANGAQDDRSLDELQKAIDVIPNGTTRDEFVSCQFELQKYVHAQKMIAIAYRTNLAKSMTDDAAMKAAEKANPEPDSKAAADCEIRRLGRLAR